MSNLDRIARVFGDVRPGEAGRALLMLANIFTVLLFVFGVIAVKTVLNIAVLRLVGQPWERAFPAGLMIAQIGEFSFVIAAIGVTGKVIDADVYKLAISVIAMSLILSPLWMASVRRFDHAARGGIRDIRDTLHEVYGDEIETLGTVAALIRHLAVKAGLATAPTASRMRVILRRAGLASGPRLTRRGDKEADKTGDPKLQLPAPEEREEPLVEDRR